MNEMKRNDFEKNFILTIILRCIHIKLPFFPLSIINEISKVFRLGETLCIPYTTKSLFFEHNLFIEIASIKEIYFYITLE